MEYLVHYVIEEEGHERNYSRIVTPPLSLSGALVLQLEARLQKTEKGTVRILSYQKIDSQMTLREAKTLIEAIKKEIPDVDEAALMRALNTWIS